MDSVSIDDDERDCIMLIDCAVLIEGLKDGWVGFR